MTLKKLTTEEFEIFTNNYPDKSIFQTKEYGFVMSEEEFNVEFYGLVDNESVIAASLILIKKDKGYKYAYAPRGFLIDYKNFELLETFTNLLSKVLNKDGVVAIKIAPLVLKDESSDEIIENLKKLKYWHFGFNNYFEALKPRFEASIDLKKPLTDIFYNIDRNYRKNIKSSDLKGIRIIKGDKYSLKYLHDQTKRKYIRDLTYYNSAFQFFNDNIEFYYAKLDTSIYLDYIRERFELTEAKNNLINSKVSNHKIPTTDSLINKKMDSDSELNKLKKELVVARKYLETNPEGIIIATALIIKNKDYLYLLMDGMNKAYKNFSGKHLLIWKLIEKYHKLGYNHFNLGGIINPDIEDVKKYKGLNQFKLGLGAKPIEYIGDFELITNPSKYFLYKKKIPLFGFIKL